MRFTHPSSTGRMYGLGMLLCLLGGMLLLEASPAWGAPTVVVVVDDSGSMTARMRQGVKRIDAARDALKVVLKQLPADAQIGILALNSGWILPLQPLGEANPARKIDRLRASGGTPLGSFMKLATDELLKKREEETYGDYRLLVVTDGEATDQAMLEAVLPDILSRGITVEAIGVDMESDHSLATRVHAYRRADDPEALRQAIAEALAESDDDSGASGESDFELLAGLPVDLAPAVLTTLTSINNAPIGEQVSGHTQPGPGSVPPRTQPSPAPRGNGGGGVLGFLGAVFCMGVAFVIVLGIAVLFRVASRH